MMGAVSLDLDLPRRIAYQGEPGANSHIACADAYPDWEPMACASFEDAFAAVTDGSAGLAMIPIDNTLAGRVADIHHFLPTSGLHIVGEYFLPIHFDLLAVPGATLDQITEVHSHVHALGQCRRIIREHGLTPVIAGDTAGAAREVAEWGDPTKAARATPLAARTYGLETLASTVEDEEHNTTRFVVLSRHPEVPPPGDWPTVTILKFKNRIFLVALYMALGGFASNGINMTKLESYMVGGTFTATMFLAEVDGHPDDPPLARALEELAFFSTDVQVMGVYPAHPHRFADA